MIVIGYNPRPLGERFTSKRTASSPFVPSMLAALYRAVDRHPEWSPSLSIMLVGQTAADFAEEHWV